MNTFSKTSNLRQAVLPLRCWMVVVLALGLMARHVTAANDELLRREWTVDGVAREALIHVPAQGATAHTPIVFVFHGHGGTMKQVARSIPVHQQWPAALVVYPQGLNTPGQLTDPQGKRSGWQSSPGENGDRDVKFFDVILADLHKEYSVAASGVFIAGHSNGGTFTYVLWAARGDRLAAVASCAAVALKLLDKLKPKPALHLAGEKDPLVKFAWQHRMMESVRKLNGCQAGKAWGTDPHATMYPSTKGTPLVTLIHAGQHEVPAWAPALLVKFFQEQVHPAAGVKP